MPVSSERQNAESRTPPAHPQADTGRNGKRTARCYRFLRRKESQEALLLRRALLCLPGCEKSVKHSASSAATPMQRARSASTWQCESKYKHSPDRRLWFPPRGNKLAWTQRWLALVSRTSDEFFQAMRAGSRPRPWWREYASYRGWCC